MVALPTREERRNLLADMTRQAVDDGTYGKPAAWFEDEPVDYAGRTWADRVEDLNAYYRSEENQ